MKISLSHLYQYGTSNLNVLYYSECKFIKYGTTAQVQLWTVSWKAPHREDSIHSIILNQGVTQWNYLLEDYGSVSQAIKYVMAIHKE